MKFFLLFPLLLLPFVWTQEGKEPPSGPPPSRPSGPPPSQPPGPPPSQPPGPPPYHGNEGNNWKMNPRTGPPSQQTGGGSWWSNPPPPGSSPPPPSSSPPPSPGPESPPVRNERQIFETNNPAYTTPPNPFPGGPTYSSPPYPYPAGPTYSSPPYPYPGGPTYSTPPYPYPGGPTYSSPPYPYPGGPTYSSPPYPYPGGPTYSTPPYPYPGGPTYSSPPYPYPGGPTYSTPPYPYPSDYYTNIPPYWPEPCCEYKQNGGYWYQLVREFDQTTNYFGCTSNCVYQRLDNPDKKFCFQFSPYYGTETTSCGPDGPDPKPEPIACQCGVSYNNTDVWKVLLMGADVSLGKTYCYGTLISNKDILTSSSCFHYLGAEAFVQIGEELRESCGSFSAGQTPDSKYFSLAIYSLCNPVDISDLAIAPACLPSPDLEIRNLTGRTFLYDMEKNITVEAEVQVFGHLSCFELLMNKFNQSEVAMNFSPAWVCGYIEEARGLCNVESGAPVLADGEKTVVLGSVSSGAEHSFCISNDSLDGSSSSSLIFLINSVVPELDWINQTYTGQFCRY